MLISVFILGITACNDNPLSRTNGEWLIPENEIFDGGPGKDQEADNRVSRRPQAQGRHARSNPLLCRAAWGRQKANLSFRGKLQACQVSSEILQSTNLAIRKIGKPWSGKR